MLPDGWNPAVTGTPAFDTATHDLHAAQVFRYRAPLPTIEMSGKRDWTQAASGAADAGLLTRELGDIAASEARVEAWSTDRMPPECMRRI